MTRLAGCVSGAEHFETYFANLSRQGNYSLLDDRWQILLQGIGYCRYSKEWT